MTHPAELATQSPSVPAARQVGRALARLLAGYRSEVHRMEVALAAAQADAAALRSENESWRAGGLCRRACRAEVERDLALAEAKAAAAERATADAIADRIEAVSVWPTEGVSAERARIGGWVNNMRSLAVHIARGFPGPG